MSNFEIWSLWLQEVSSKVLGLLCPLPYFANFSASSEFSPLNAA
jgi:hypothetical protein